MTGWLLPLTLYIPQLGAYFSEPLADRFIRSPKEVMEAIMAGINVLVQEFWTSSDGALQV